MMFHVIPERGAEPTIDMIFDVQVLDEDGLSSEDVNNLYLITKKAILSGETKQAWHEGNIVSADSLRDVISTPEVISIVAGKLESKYKEEHGVSIKADHELVREILQMAIDDFENSV
jgi:hypothetical protein